MIQPLNSLKNWSNADWSNALVIFLVLNTQAILYLKSEYSKQILLYLVYIFCTFAAGYQFLIHLPICIFALQALCHYQVVIDRI